MIDDICSAKAVVSDDAGEAVTDVWLLTDAELKQVAGGVRRQSGRLYYRDIDPRSYHTRSDDYE